jgi:hypothetical protein
MSVKVSHCPPESRQLQNPQEMLIFVIPRTKNQSITVKGNNIALGFATASSQEGSVIAFFAMTRGVVPQTKCHSIHS